MFFFNPSNVSDFYHGFGIGFRYMSQGKHAEARELMYSGALLFFSHNQVSHSFCVCIVRRGVVFPRFWGVSGEFSIVNVWGNCFVIFCFISLLSFSPPRRIMPNWNVIQKCLWIIITAFGLLSWRSLFWCHQIPVILCIREGWGLGLCLSCSCW